MNDGTQTSNLFNIGLLSELFLHPLQAGLIDRIGRSDNRALCGKSIALHQQLRILPLSITQAKRPHERIGYTGSVLAWLHSLYVPSKPTKNIVSISVGR